MINGMIYFLANWAENDVKPDFRKFHVPKNEVFYDRVTRGFELRLLKTEQTKQKEKKAHLHAISEMSRNELFWN